MRIFPVCFPLPLLHFPEHTPFSQVEFEMFVGAKPNEGRGCMKQSSPGLDDAPVLTHRCPCQGSAALSTELCQGTSTAGKLCCLVAFAEKGPV